MRQNRLQDAFAILEHLIVPEAKPLPALARQIGVTDIVLIALGVLRTVSLDDQLSSNAKKVDDVRPDRSLPAKLEAVQAAITKEASQAEFGVSRRSAHRSGARALVRRDACVSRHRSSLSGPSSVAPAARHLLPEGEGGAAPQSAPTFCRREKGSGDDAWHSLLPREKVARSAG